MIRRAVALGFVLVTCIFRFWLMRLGGPRTLERRARWVHETCVAACCAAWILNATSRASVPTHGLVVANHLSYLDILMLSAAMPCFFVAKAEIGAGRISARPRAWVERCFSTAPAWPAQSSVAP